ncbi:Cof-type HAD-IIB family hydrolase [Acetobacter oeni]|uniref:Haloacid dehalogenase n=1 Tax=Acetobacter oeni TaxID=304077 RepID=A0A511XNW4_9PROT|nr:Cof-type HAD-IIB family hydrolase [Acetobacter oeni]MBB3882620.1 hypothetical protein [Acetobacter oeni]NHO18724.1 Cof-type HAD-IIB family hydrolase [Acetobacter oeni]GBR08988.1 hydrolase [Acetobacter oeni LMG 21952]GEN64641.1 haloacid dehalogenase [Acetobacter oeni]
MTAAAKQPDSVSIRLVLADVDGTLVTREKVLTARAIKAVRVLRERGIRFAITSGRPPRGMDMLIGPLEIDTPIAGFNGGLMVNPDSSVVRSLTLSPDCVKKTTALMHKAGIDVWLYRGNDWIVPDISHPHVARERWTVKFDPTVRADIDSITDNIVKITGVSDDQDAMKRLEAETRKALGNSAFAALSQPYYLDVTHRDANKGGVVRTLSRLLDIPASQIATLGDQPNDVPMFEVSGLSVAMGQANDTVKAKASHVTESCEDEGFAIAIERYVLGDSQ